MTGIEPPEAGEITDEDGTTARRLRGYQMAFADRGLTLEPEADCDKRMIIGPIETPEALPSEVWICVFNSNDHQVSSGSPCWSVRARAVAAHRPAVR